ncbi:MAG TPA: hypothetical protein VNW06_09430 [Cytophagaceae bacterium]|nr:hypothetical protein [Cytophagaceae bacterium]
MVPVEKRIEKYINNISFDFYSLLPPVFEKENSPSAKRTTAGIMEKLLIEDFTLSKEIVLEEIADYYTLSNSDISSFVRKAVGRVAGLQNGSVLELETLQECLKEICENQDLPYAPLDQMRLIKGKVLVDEKYLLSSKIISQKKKIKYQKELMLILKWY